MSNRARSQVCVIGRWTLLVGAGVGVTLTPGRVAADQCKLAPEVADGQHAVYAVALGPGSSEYPLPFEAVLDARLKFQSQGKSVDAEASENTVDGEVVGACIRFALPNPREFPRMLAVGCKSNPVIACGYEVPLDPAIGEDGSEDRPMRISLLLVQVVTLQPRQADALAASGLSGELQLSIGEQQVAVNREPDPSLTTVTLSDGAAGCAIVEHALREAKKSVGCTGGDVSLALGVLAGDAATFVEQRSNLIVGYNSRRSAGRWIAALPEAERAELQASLEDPWVAGVVSDVTTRTVPPKLAAGSAPENVAAQAEFQKALAALSVGGEVGDESKAAQAVKLIGLAPHKSKVLEGATK